MAMVWWSLTKDLLTHVRNKFLSGHFIIFIGVSISKRSHFLHQIHAIWNSFGIQEFLPCKCTIAILTDFLKHFFCKIHQNLKKILSKIFLINEREKFVPFLIFVKLTYRSHVLCRVVFTISDFWYPLLYFKAQKLLFSSCLPIWPIYRGITWPSLGSHVAWKVSLSIIER